MTGPLAPIVLFAFQRPEHTRRTIEALQRNPEARQSILWIFADGPRSERDAEKVEETRRILRGVSGFGEIRLCEREENFGLTRSSRTGITQAIEEAGRVIVVEDDIVTQRLMRKILEERGYDVIVASGHARTTVAVARPPLVRPVTQSSLTNDSVRSIELSLTSHLSPLTFRAAPLAPGRHAYLALAKGSAEVNSVALAARDGAAIRDEANVTITASEDAEVVLVDAP